jgi:hypothetical protein
MSEEETKERTRLDREQALARGLSEHSYTASSSIQLWDHNEHSYTASSSIQPWNLGEHGSTISSSTQFRGFDEHSNIALSSNTSFPDDYADGKENSNVVIHYTPRQPGPARSLAYIFGNDLLWIVYSYANEVDSSQQYTNFFGKIVGITCSICELCGEFGRCGDLCPCWQHRPCYENLATEFFHLNLDYRICHYMQDREACHYSRVRTLTCCAECDRHLPFYQQHQLLRETGIRYCQRCSTSRFPDQLLQDIVTAQPLRSRRQRQHKPRLPFQLLRAIAAAGPRRAQSHQPRVSD